MSLRLLSLAAACAAALPAFAQSASTATDLDEVVVTATRTPISADASLTPVEVIDRAQIERSQARSLPDLLRGRAGISLSNQGGAGKLTTLFLRGSESDHVLVLVDGVRIGSATSGLAAFQDLPLELIERVEIVRGPRSSLYGSEAIGGVIQVFTRRDRGGVTPHATVTIGSHDMREATAGVGGKIGRGWFGADYSFRRTDGIDACRVADPRYFGCGIENAQPDRDGAVARSASLRGGVELGEALTLEGHALRNEGENDFDGDFTDRSETVQQVLGAKATWAASDRLRVQLGVGTNRDASDSLLRGAPIGDFATDRDSATLQADLTLADGQQLTLGADWLRDSLVSDTPYSTTERGNRAVFAQYLGRFGSQSIEASARRDDNDQFGGYTTGSLAWGMEFADGWRASASVGTAFKAPTFIELYYPFFGNPALEPERSRTAELGLAYRATDWGVAVNGFDTRVTDLIGFDETFHSININRAHVRGAELTGNATLGGFEIDGSLSWADAENRSAPYEGKRLPRRARVAGRLDVDRAFGDVRLGVTAAGEGARYDDFDNTRRLGGFGLLDLRAEYALAPAWTLQARLANVFDKDYETVQYYRQPGREWSLTLRYAPKR